MTWIQNFPAMLGRAFGPAPFDGRRDPREGISGVAMRTGLQASRVAAKMRT
jgi:hypothetical protein